MDKKKAGKQQNYRQLFFFCAIRLSPSSWFVTQHFYSPTGALCDNSHVTAKNRILSTFIEFKKITQLFLLTKNRVYMIIEVVRGITRAHGGYQFYSLAM